jgi:uncharacterized membrane protein YozB (DUF420 family)
MINQTFNPEQLQQVYQIQTFPALALLFLIIFFIVIVTGVIMIKGLKVKKFSLVVIVSLLLSAVVLVGFYLLPNTVQAIINSVGLGASS